MSVSDRIRVKNVRMLSDNHYTLKTTTFEWRRANGGCRSSTAQRYMGPRFRGDDDDKSS
jgi:hypothetical protein